MGVSLIVSLTNYLDYLYQTLSAIDKQISRGHALEDLESFGIKSSVL